MRTSIKKACLPAGRAATPDSYRDSHTRALRTDEVKCSTPDPETSGLTSLFDYLYLIFPKNLYKTKTLYISVKGSIKKAATYSPTNCSTICANGLNFSVRNGKR